MEAIVQNLVFGLFVGSIYGIAAAGLSIVFGVLKVLNVAHGQLLMVGGYVSFSLFNSLGLDPFLSLIITIPVLALLGLVLSKVLFSRVVQMEPETRIKNSLLISFGLVLILQNLALQLWTADERSIQTTYSGLGFVFFGVSFPYTRLATLMTAFLTILVLQAFLKWTFIGKAIRATAEDWESATLAGIDVQRIYLITFALGAASAAVAGALVGLGYGITPNIGLAWTLKALVVVVLAGTGSVFGTFPAGLLLGLAEAASGLVPGGAAYREVVGLIIFLVILLLRPQGLFGKG